MFKANIRFIIANNKFYDDVNINNLDGLIINGIMKT